MTPNVEFHFAGLVNQNYVERVQQLTKKGKLINHGYLNWKELNELREKCNIGLVSWSNNTLNTKYCAPNKLYEYIASGMCVICFDNYSLNELSKQYDFGASFEAPEELAQYVHALSIDEVNEKGKMNYELFLSELNYEFQTKTLFFDLNEAAKGSS